MAVDSTKPRPPTYAEIVRLYHPNPLARAFATVHDQRLRYVARWRQWMTWDGTRWRPDDTQLALDLARDICFTAGNTACVAMPSRLGLRVLNWLSGPGGSVAVERLARTDRRLAAAPEQFDADPDLLNTPSGILDTRTGALTPHRMDAFLTRITLAAPAAPGTPCPAWDGLIGRMTGGDMELHFFLQRVVGRALVRRAAPPPAAADGEHPLVDALARLLGDASAAAAVREGLELVRLDPVARDPDLADRMVGEYPAILRWAIEGCLAWRRIGLAPPTHARRPAAVEAIARFLGADAEASPMSWVAAGELYARWAEWTEEAGLDAGSQKAFCRGVAAAGFAPARRHGGRRGFAGLRLRAVAEAAAAAARPSPSASAGADARETPHPAPSSLGRPGPRPGGNAAAHAAASKTLRPEPVEGRDDDVAADQPTPSVTMDVGSYLMSPPAAP